MTGFLDRWVPLFVGLALLGLGGLILFNSRPTTTGGRTVLLGVATFAGGLWAVRSGWVRHGVIEVLNDSVVIPRLRLLGDSSCVVSFQTTRSIAELNFRGDQVEVVVVFQEPGEAATSALTCLVPRALSAEFVARVALRVHAARLEVPRAVQLLELAQQPGRKPLGIAYLEETWRPFMSASELVEAPAHDRAPIQVFMNSPEFGVLARMHPELRVERLGPVIQERR